jgi:hypothetical protein
MAPCNYFLQGAMNHLLYLACTHLPLDLTWLDHLSVIVTIQFTNNEQLKDLTLMFCLQVPCYKLYKRKLVLLHFHIKIHVPFWDELKKTEHKSKTLIF